MARVDSLGHFLTDVADAIREKKGTSETIQASDFDTEIENLPSGADLSEYFNTEIVSNTSNTSTMNAKTIKKLPNVIVSDNVVSLQYAYSYLNGEELGRTLPKIICNDNVTNISYMYQNLSNVDNLDLSGMNTTNVNQMHHLFYSSSVKQIDFGANFDTQKITDMSYMFAYCSNLTALDLSSFYTPNLSTINFIFYNCRSLRFLDIRNMTFNKVSNKTNVFNSVPTDCEIIVKDQTQKDWFTTNFSTLTNVKTVAEYETEQSE